MGVVLQREEAFHRAQKDAERKRQERELLHIQEEQERQQRKKVLKKTTTMRDKTKTKTKIFHNKKSA